MSSGLWWLGGMAVTMDPKGSIVEDSAIQITDGKISWIGKRADALIPKGASVVDCTKCLVFPGFINGHTHIGMSLFRGMANDMPLGPWLKERIFPLEARWCRPDFVSAASTLSALELIRAGVTTIADMYYFQIEAARAASQAGLRVCAGYAFPDPSKKQTPASMARELDSFASDLAELKLARPAVAPHSSYTVDPKFWEPMFRYVADHRWSIFIHISESQEEESGAVARLGMSTVKYFDQLGLWDLNAVAAHCVELGPEEIEILGKHRAGVSYNPESNMKLGNRICPVVELRRAGARVCLGTDGAVSNNNLQILQEADTGTKLQVLRHGPGALKAEDMVRMLTIEGAAALRIEDQIGSIELGKQADLVAVDVWKPHLQPLYDPYAHLIYCATSQDIKHSMVSGRVLMQDYVVTSLDQEAVLNEAQEWGRKVRSSS